MKKKVFELSTFLLVLLILAACSNPAGPPPDTRERMTFTDSLVPPNREFTIFDDLGFSVTFLNLGTDPEMEEFLTGLGIGVGTVVTGNAVVQTGDTWTSDISGVAENLGSPNNGDLAFLFEKIPISVDIEISYTIDPPGDPSGEITAITVEFPGAINLEDLDESITDQNVIYATTANAIMGGTYQRK